MWNFLKQKHRKSPGFRTPLVYLLRGPRMGVGSVVVGFGVFGVPRFSVQRSQNAYFKGFWDLCTKNRGAPKNAKDNHDASSPPFSAHWPSLNACGQAVLELRSVLIASCPKSRGDWPAERAPQGAYQAPAEGFAKLFLSLLSWGIGRKAGTWAFFGRRCS